MHSKLPRSQY